jgi:hypothetical protein
MRAKRDRAVVILILLFVCALFGAICGLIVSGSVRVFGGFSSFLLFLAIAAILKILEWLLRLIRTIPRDIEKIVSNSHRRLVLYLRSFDSDDEIGGSWVVNIIPFVSMSIYKIRSETLLVRSLSKVGSVVALGRPDEKIPRLGAYRLFVSDEEWQEKVRSLLDRAQLIVFKPGKSLGLFWEFEEVMTRHQFAPFLVFPQGGDKAMSILAYHTFAERFERRFNLHLPENGAYNILAFHSPHNPPIVCGDIEQACESVGIPISRSLLSQWFKKVNIALGKMNRTARVFTVILAVVAVIVGALPAVLMFMPDF